MVQARPWRSHFSERSGVSLTLPHDWHEAPSDDYAAFYASASVPTAQIGIQPYPVDESESNALVRIGKALAGQDTAADASLERTVRLVDGRPGLLLTSETRTPAGQPAVSSIALVRVDAYVVSFVLVLARDDVDQFLPLFSQVLDSVRFVGSGDEEEEP